MGQETTELDRLLAREAIRNCLARLARGEDRREADTLRASFWPDATVDFGVFRGDFEAYLAWVVPGAEVITNTQHLLGQSVIDLDGGSARAETQVVSYHRLELGADGGGNRDTVIGGRYLDRMERRDGEWRIAARVMIYDWYSDWGEAIDWAQGIMGQPLSADHFAGRSHGDISGAFFAGKDF